MSGTSQQKAPTGRAISLIDEDGAGVVGALSDGTAVEILRWAPRGAKTLYHVRSSRDGSLAWVGARDLRAGMATAARPSSPKPSRK